MTADQANRFRERAELLQKELESHAASAGAGASDAARAATALRSAVLHLKNLRAALRKSARRRKR